MFYKLLLLTFIPILIEAYSLPDGIYCGVESCYDVLGVSREATKSDVQKVYRNLARKFHPDRVSADQKEEADKNFKRISQAYEVLRDAEQRKEYDYMLDNPSEMYFNYYQYYKRRLTPKVDVRIVIVSIILVLSVLHYIGQVTNYNLGLNYLIRDPKHRKKAEEIAINEGKMSFKRHLNGVRLTKDKIKAIEDQIIRSVLAEHFTLRGSCEKPSVFRTPLFQIILLPYHLLQSIYSCSRWVVKYWILNQPYDDDAKVYITRKKLGLSTVRWEGLGEEQHEVLLALEFWTPGNFEKYREEQLRLEREHAARSGRYKQAIRYNKNRVPDKLNLEDYS